MSPTVALTLCGHDRPRCRWARDLYLRGLTDEGLTVIAVDPGDPLPKDIAGLCLSGGEDVAPERYGAVPDGSEPPYLERDATEIALLEQARAQDLPILAICRGFQLVNVALGGALVQHIGGHTEGHGPIVPHVLAAAPGSLLASACGTAPHRVNSYHHQAVTEALLAPGLRPTAAIDGFVEAFESTSDRWLVGVQWHPERDDVAPEAKGIFRAFAAAATGASVTGAAATRDAATRAPAAAR